MKSKYSDFMVYVDESGDHSLQSIDKNYPVFVLAFCIFYKDHYRNNIVPQIQKLKFDYFGHDMVILHEHEIRKEKGDFNIFTSREQREEFMERISSIIEKTNFILAGCVIDKRKIPQNETTHPYHFSLKHCLETLYEFVCEKHQEDKITFVAVESRGRNEDRELELEFLRICDGQNKFKKSLPFQVKIVPKQINSVGLQVADLVARPIGRHILDSNQPNRAFEILKKKFYCEGGRKILGENFDQKGLKHFP
ncbi:3-deoxy-D-manno-octulosonic-acid transferase [Haemophilus influenzae]|nr:DUF3800 domain-containing protein [Haemophilus influenzae]AJO88711.1 hypothetical protein NTHI477_01755 [Haemophilus influenzae]CWX11299.1 3-deoxy-D-manno-octulosonic-acid transferase [Haemophilus influenzae]CWX54922.1 3-deoxy-D-manno-octulosonic-acid transferase [Haemophilus influenzae]